MKKSKPHNQRALDKKTSRNLKSKMKRKQGALKELANKKKVA